MIFGGIFAELLSKIFDGRNACENGCRRHRSQRLYFDWRRGTDVCIVAQLLMIDRSLQYWFLLLVCHSSDT